MEKVKKLAGSVPRCYIGRGREVVVRRCGPAGVGTCFDLQGVNGRWSPTESDTVEAGIVKARRAFARGNGRKRGGCTQGTSKIAPINDTQTVSARCSRGEEKSRPAQEGFVCSINPALSDRAKPGDFT